MQATEQTTGLLGGKIPFGIPPPTARDAWQTTLGMFDGDELMMEIDELGAQWRKEQAERDIAEMEATAAK
ncbi:hypothetical protein [Prosthecobacter sp.]|uniref:hypothetical protein n=1 Tax=Prosthecobacter sp. TaxID=1965333 RepID=UPI00378490E8